MADSERNRLSARAARYARVGTNMSGVAAKFAASRLFGFGLDRGKNAAALAAALGGLKGPIMKVAQLMATIPDLLPPEYVEELQKLRGSITATACQPNSHWDPLPMECDSWGMWPVLTRPPAKPTSWPPHASRQAASIDRSLHSR